MTLSPLLTVRQNLPSRTIQDIAGEVYRQLSSSALKARLRPGSRLAIGVGSRGIANIAGIARATVGFWKSEGVHPFIFPAMGSHGAATAEGQQHVLENYGITERAMGCPIVSRLDVVSTGRTPEGIETFVDKAAYESDGIMLLARVKWHTDFAGGIESGLFKMMAIGLGKFAGAQRYHSHAYNLGLETVIRSVGRQVLATGKVMGGLAILEDPYHHTARLVPVEAEGMEQREQELLREVKSGMARIPFPVDILIVDEIGKNYSGAGMDTKVINRGVYGESNHWDTAPRIERIYLRGISPNSYGNAVGIGMADMVHERILDKIDWNATQINSLTSNSLPCIRTPIHFASDRLCLEKLWPTVGKLREEDVTVAWIPNTLDITTLGVTANLLPAIRENSRLEILQNASEWPFDANGNLPERLVAEATAA